MAYPKSSVPAFAAQTASSHLRLPSGSLTRCFGFPDLLQSISDLILSHNAPGPGARCCINFPYGVLTVQDEPDNIPFQKRRVLLARGQALSSEPNLRSANSHLYSRTHLYLDTATEVLILRASSIQLRFTTTLPKQASRVTLSPSHTSPSPNARIRTDTVSRLRYRAGASQRLHVGSVTCPFRRELSEQRQLL